MKGIRLLAAAALLATAGCAVSPVATGTAVAPVPAGTGWAMEGGDAARRSRADGSPGDRWGEVEIFDYDEFHHGYSLGEFSSPLVVGGRIIFGTTARAVICLDGATLAPRWKYATKGRVFTSPAYADGKIFAGDDEGRLFALDLDGREAWSADFVYPLASSPVIASGRLYVVGGDQVLYCADAATGRQLWQFGKPFPARNRIWRGSSLAVGDGRVYLGTGDGAVAALDPSNGAILWRVGGNSREPFADVVAGPAFDGGVVYAGTRKGSLSAYRAEDGSKLWENRGGAASGVAVGEKLVYVGGDDGSVRAVRRDTGETAWTAALDGLGTPCRPTLAGDLLLIGTSEGALFGLDAETGLERARYSPGSGVQAQPWAGPEGWILHSNAGNIHRMKRNGTWD